MEFSSAARRFRCAVAVDAPVADCAGRIVVHWWALPGEGGTGAGRSHPGKELLVVGGFGLIGQRVIESVGGLLS